MFRDLFLSLFVSKPVGEVDVRHWRNCNLNDVTKLKKAIKGYVIKDDLMPKNWELGGVRHSA